MKFKIIQRTAERWALQTAETTAAYKMKDGSIRYTLAGYPIEGAKLLEVKPPGLEKKAA